MRKQWHRFLLAVQFLTRLRVRVADSVTPADLAASMTYYPLVGFLLALMAAAAGWALHWLLPPSVVVAWTWVLLLFFTGSLHVDGVMDTADGLYGGRDPARRRDIMRDSAIGAYGVVAAVSVLGLKLLLLLQFPVTVWWRVLGIALASGRWALVYGACFFDDARPEGGIATAYLQSLRPGHMAAATVLWGAVVLISSPQAAAIGAILLLVAGFVALTGRYIAGKVGGMTGDTLGALNEMTEVFVLTVLLAWQSAS